MEQLLRDFPSSRELFEYGDYQAASTRGNASEFITRAMEDNYEQVAKKENYVDYIANRPRAQKLGTHGLFTAGDNPLVLSQVADEVAHHPGTVWLPIISLRREDAARLGFDNAERWRKLLSAHTMDMAEAMKIPYGQFRWYAAFHDEAHHPHLHMVCYSAGGKSGFLSKEGIAQIKSMLADEIFHQDLIAIYQRQTQRRDELTQSAGEIMAQLVTEMQAGAVEDQRIGQLMVELAQRLRDRSGKKQYGYLPPALKSLVDEIVNELEKDPRVAAAYDLWYQEREEVLRTYKDDLPRRDPLVRQKEFKRIKNIIVQEAARLGALIPSDIAAQADGEPTDRPSEDSATDAPGDFGTARSRTWWTRRYRAARQLMAGDADSPPDHAAAFDLLVGEAEGGNALAMADLGRMYADGLGREPDPVMAREWYAKALAAFLQAEKEAPDRVTQYRIGRLYASGLGTEQDYAAARELYAKAVTFPYAAYELGKLYRDGLGGEADEDRAARYFRQAFLGFQFLADRSPDDKLQYRIGWMLLHGVGTERDEAAALPWLEKAAAAGNQTAKYQLGRLLLTGADGVPRDTDRALDLLTRCAEAGNQYAQYALGKAYLLGQDIPQDQERAVQWLKLSAEQGNQYAKFFLDRVYGSLFFSTASLLYHMGRIFQEQRPQPVPGIQAAVDSKLKRKIREKKIAMGHKPDDHEDHQQTM